MSNGKSLLVLCSLAVVVAVAVHSASGATATNPQGRAALGSACNNQTNRCTAPNSVCSGVSRTCICEDGYEVNQNNRTTCVSKLNSYCNASRPCNRPGAQCVSTVCKCNSDHITSSNQTHCLPFAASLNSQCTEERQCSKLVNSTCWGGACICKANTFQTSNTACGVKTCQSNSCDYLGYAVCVAGTCRCDTNGFAYGSRCYKTIVDKVGNKCTNFDLCYLSADGANQHVSCTKGKCTCNKPYKPNKAKTSCSGAAGTLISITTALLAVVAAMQA